MKTRRQRMNARDRHVIQRAMGFDMEKVRKRYAADNQVSLEDAKLLEPELKRYLILGALRPGKRYGMAGPVDDLWHTFLLFTRLYARFCTQVAGRFLHHTPTDSENPDEPRRFTKYYARFWKDYEAVFGEPPPGSIWPSIAMFRAPEGKSR